MSHFKAIPENARIIDNLVEYICQNSLDDVLSYGVLSKIAKRSIQGKGRYLLQKSVEKAEKRLGCIFACVHGVGIKRLAADETSQIGAHSITHIRRKAKRSVKRMARVSSNEMTADARMLATMKIVHLQYIGDMADNRRTSTFPIPATADPYAAKKASA